MTLNEARELIEREFKRIEDRETDRKKEQDESLCYDILSVIRKYSSEMPGTTSVTYDGNSWRDMISISPF